MKIVSKIALAAAFGLALMFTFSCSSDDGGNGTTAACKFTTTFRNSSVEVCEYSSKEDLAAEGHTVDRVKKECEAEAARNGSKFYESCPDGYVLKCIDENDDYEAGILYLYGDAFKNIDCNEFFRDY